MLRDRNSLDRVAEDPDLRAAFTRDYLEGGLSHWELGRKYFPELQEDYQACRKRADALRIRLKLPTHRELAAARQLRDAPPTEFQELLDRFNTTFCLGHREVERKLRPENPAGTEQVIVMSDLHAPHTRVDLLDYVSRRYEGATCILDGDLFDFYWQSRFPQRGLNPGLLQEIQHGVCLVHALARRFSRIYLILGNHDEERLAKHLATCLGPQDAVLAQFFMDLAFAPLPNVHLTRRTLTWGKGSEYQTSDHFQYGELMVGHFDKYGASPLRGAVAAWDWVRDHPSSFDTRSVRAFVQAHTHKLSSMIKQDVLLVECGSMALTQGYQIKQHRGPEPQPGYARFTLYDGQVDLEESGIHALPRAVETSRPAPVDFLPQETLWYEEILRRVRSA